MTYQNRTITVEPRLSRETGRKLYRINFERGNYVILNRDELEQLSAVSLEALDVHRTT